MPLDSDLLARLGEQKHLYIRLNGNSVHEELVALSAECESAAADVQADGQDFQKIRAAIRQQLDAQGLSDRLDKAVSELLELGKSE